MSIAPIRSLSFKRAAVSAAALIAAATAGSALAADLGGDCCGDLEERVAELEASTAKKKKSKVELTVTGVVNRAVIFWNDGGIHRASIVDPAIDSTGISLEGGAKIGNGWKTGYKFKFDTNAVASDEFNQLGKMSEPEKFKIDRSFVYVENEKLGQVALGFNKSASRSIDNMEFTDSETTDAAVDDWMGGFFLRTRDGKLLDLPWGEFLLGKFAGKKTNIALYTSPKWNGFEFSASVGNNEMRDVALRYSQEFAKTWKFKAGIGYYRTELPVPGTTEPVKDQVLGGSIALLHIPTGINIAYNSAGLKHTDACTEPGVLSGKCRGNDVFHNVRGGVVREFNSLGKTSLYGEYYTSKTRNHLSDADTITAFAVAPTATTELTSTTSRVWGFGVTQHIENAQMQIYAGYRHHTLDLKLEDAGGAVADKGLKPFDLVFTGLRIEF
jgi:Gram-negative porin